MLEFEILRDGNLNPTPMNMMLDRIDTIPLSVPCPYGTDRSPTTNLIYKL